MGKAANGHANSAYDGTGKDLRSEARTSQYNNFWQNNSANDSEVDKQNRLDQYKEVVNGGWSRLVVGSVPRSLSCRLPSAKR
jgi:hypothetical protein